MHTGRTDFGHVVRTSITRGICQVLSSPPGFRSQAHLRPLIQTALILLLMHAMLAILANGFSVFLADISTMSTNHHLCASFLKKLVVMRYAK